MDFIQRVGKSLRFNLMYSGNAPYTTKLEIACVMFIEPCESKDDKSCRLTHVSMAKLMKAYEEMDEDLLA